MLYDFFNPVRAKLIPYPTHIKWRLFSTARYMAFGEENEFTCMITLPDWYMRLGRTKAQSQRKCRQMLDRYAIEKGYKHDPKKARGMFVGDDQRVASMRQKIGAWIKAHKAIEGTCTDPPDI